MRRAVAALLFVVCGTFVPHVVFAVQNIVDDIYGARLSLSEDTVIAAGVVVATDAVYIDKSVRAHNMAEITGDIYVCDNCDFYIRNSGDMSGVVHLGDGAHLVQVVRDSGDVTRVDVDGGFVVLADSARGMSWRELSAMGADAGTLVLRDSEIVMDGFTAPFAARESVEPLIVAHGVIVLRMPDGYVRDSVPIMRNVTGDGAFLFDGNAGELYAFVADIRNGDLFLNVARETDYYKILGNETGRALNLLRDKLPEDRLLRKLDAAQTMDDLNHVLDKSAAFHPIRLARPMRVLDEFMLNDSGGLNINSSEAAVAGVRPFLIYSSELFVSGISADFSYVPTGWMRMGMSLYGAVMQTDDGINDFGAEMYGARVALDFLSDAVYSRVVLGATFADFDVPYMFDGDEIKSGASGASIYGAADVGIRAGLLAPYVGIGWRTVKVEQDLETTINARAGIGAELARRDAELAYKYRFSAGADSDDSVHATIAAGLWSADDMMGGEASVGIGDTDGITTYTFAISAKVEF